MSHPRPKKEQKQIARERIRVLFQEAEGAFSKNPSLSHRYVELARKIAMKVKVKIPPEFKRRFCKHCYKFLMPGVNARIRIREGKLVVYCRECKKFMRMMLKRKI